MLVHHPHDLAGVHGGTAAQGDDAVRLEGNHGLGAFFCAGQGRIGSYVEEGGVLNAHFIQLIGNGLGVSVVIQEGVRYDEAALLTHYVLQLI